MIAPGMHLNCIQTCTEHALGVRSWCAHWCVPKTPRHPTGRAARVGTASFPRVRESSLVKKRPHLSAEGCTIALRIRRDCIQTCTKRALVVRSEDSTAPYMTPNQCWNCVVLAQVRIQACQKRPQFSAEGCPDSPLNAPGLHSNMHQTCTRGAFRRLHDTLQDG